ncbi:1662_t:CDS:2, partial [Ambispora leptoticha]
MARFIATNLGHSNPNRDASLQAVKVSKKEYYKKTWLFVEEAEKKLDEHIGFAEEKETFLNHIKVYKMTNGSFWPAKEVICYFSAPGMGKTTFVKTLAKAMGRECETISLSGFQETSEYSILGDENKPSLVAWVIKKTGCKNPVILLDELEKAEDPKIQKELLELFGKYKNKEKFTD